MKCACDAEYAGDGFTCSDINECPEADTCDVNAACDSIAESYVYTCNNGYSGDEKTCTDDDDECVSGENTCHVMMVNTNARVTKDTKETVWSVETLMNAPTILAMPMLTALTMLARLYAQKYKCVI